MYGFRGSYNLHRRSIKLVFCGHDFASNRQVNKFAFEQAMAIETIVRPWLKERETEIEELNKNLPGNKTLSARDTSIIAAKPLAKLVKVRKMRPPPVRSATCRCSR